MKREDYIITEKDGRFGLSLTDGTVITECVYDEVRPMSDSFRCRLYKHVDTIGVSDGKCSVLQREGCVRKDEIESNGKITPDVLKWYDRIEEKVEGYTIVYLKGKFGINAPDGHQILPCEYDELEKWFDDDVIAARRGNDYLYFDAEGNKIRTDRPTNAPEDDFPYTQDDGLADIVKIKELVPEKINDYTYESDAGHVCLYVMSIPKRAEQVFTPCSIIPMPQEAKENFLNEFSYEFSAYIGTFDLNTPINDWIKVIKGLGAYNNSFHFIDKFSTNSKTRISLSKFVEIKRYYYDYCACLGGSPHIAYTIDESLKDGQVRWEHDEHYQEHCFPGLIGIGNLVCDGSLADLKQAVEEAEWDEGDPYGGCFFHFGNIRYTEARSWEETKKVIEYIAEYHPDYNRLLSESIDGLSWSSKASELKFYLKTLQLALENGAAVNIENGGTPFDYLHKSLVFCRHDKRLKRGRMRMVKILQKAIDLLRSYGGMSKKELREMQDKKIAQLAPDSYDYLKEI